MKRDARQDFSQAKDAGRDDQPMGDRRYRNVGDVHGGAGHLYCERGAATHRGKFIRGAGRIHLGADFVSRFERNRAAAVGMVFGINRAEKVLHVVRGDIYGEFVPVWAGAEPGRAGDFPDFAGGRRWRIAAQRASDFERYVSAREAWHGVCSVRASRRRSPHHRPMVRR